MEWGKKLEEKVVPDNERYERKVLDCQGQGAAGPAFRRNIAVWTTSIERRKLE